MIKWLPAAVLAVLVAMTAGCDQPAQQSDNAQGGSSTSTTASEAGKPASPATPGEKPAGGEKSSAGPTKVADKDYKTLDGGLKYAILKPGSGEGAKDGQRITMHYSGWLKDGTKFDSSLDRGQPFDFTLGRHEVIQGWDKGVIGMKPGEKRQLVIPGDMAYGHEGRPGIPPDATLIFDVEMLKAE